MADHHKPADDIVYDLVSIQYHALKGAQLYGRYLADADEAGNAEVTEFIEECRRQDEERARRCHELLVPLTSSGIG